jgi:hypothetical protein
MRAATPKPASRPSHLAPGQVDSGSGGAAKWIVLVVIGVAAIGAALYFK